jgi:two-component system, OmpR family, sensor histidine kinase KdpD
MNEPASRLRRYGLATVACAATTLAAHGLLPYFALSNIVMVFLLSVVGVAMWQGRGPAVLAAFLNVAVFDFLFVPPRLSFAVSDLQYLLTFAVMLAVGLITGQLTAGLRFQAQVAAGREARSRAMFEAARDLSNTLTVDQAVEVARTLIGRDFEAEVAIYALDAEDRLAMPVRQGEGLDPDIAQWALDHHRPAGLGTDTLAASPWLYLPLNATLRSRGVLAVRPRDPRLLTRPGQRQQLETLALLTGMALERVHYVDVAQGATVQMESERLRNSLLAALSHDLRTPLAALVGSSQMLAVSQPPLSPTQRALADGLSEKALRMADMVTNLLDMARIQSGEIRLRVEWQSVEEMVGSALQATHGTMVGRQVELRLPASLPLVECDAVLVERVLVNLLENAGKYTPPGTPVEIVAETADDLLRLSVRDRGPGVPAGQETLIFEKFTRGESESATPGVGLGLAICRAIVLAHRGRIGVTAVQPHGADFWFTLPLGSPPAIAEVEVEAAEAFENLGGRTSP